MAVFAYEALTDKGKTRKGVLEADSPRHLRQQLRQEGLTPVSVTEADATQSRGEKGEKGKRQLSGFPGLQKRASAADVALITRQLATLVAASIPLEECLQALSRQVQKSHLKSMLTTVRAKVLEGRTLAESLATFPKTFDTLYCSMVAAGEKSGHLDAVLERLADYTEQRQVIRGKLIQAMVYPAILTLVAVGVISVLLATVVPTVVEQFADLGQDLPGMTRALIAMSDFVRSYGLGVVGFLALLILLRQRLLVNPQRRLAHDQALLKVPVVGGVGIGVDTSRFARTLSILCSSAVPLLEGMKIASGVMSNAYIRKTLGEASERVREGSSLWVALDKTQLFPPMMLHIIASGEKSGELEQMLGRAADSQDRQFENQVNLALGIFGPLLIVSMAGMVLFIVMAILTPMLDLNSLVSG